jgi:hypothetical protein
MISVNAFPKGWPLAVIAPPPANRAQRIFRCHYQCDECPNEWNDELLVAGPSWCPCCDMELEPYCVEQFEAERPEWDEEE